MHSRVNRVWLAGVVLLLCPAAAELSAAGFDELRVKRQEVFEFTAKPTLSRQGDATIISFASKAYCDATVAIEDASGRIVRHLASGVLGPNAPGRFQKNSLQDRKSTRLNSSHSAKSRMPSSA